MDMDSSEDDPPMDCHLPPSKVSPEMLNGWFQVLVCRVLKGPGGVHTLPETNIDSERPGK